MKRNGKVDFLKFIFACFIMILHLGYRPEFSIGKFRFLIGAKGYFAVTFFFIVSGFLMARSFGSENEMHSTRIDGLGYVAKKYRYYIKWYLVAFILCALLDCAKNGVVDMVGNTIKSIPSLFLLGSLGYSSDSGSIGYYIGASWYLSALFISQILLYPFMRRNYRWYINNIAPILFLVTFTMDVLGYSDSISSALCRIILGQLCFEAVLYISGKTYSKILLGALLRIAEVGIYLSCFAYMSVEGFEDFEYAMMFITAVGIMISFCKYSEYKVFEYAFFRFLGKISFPMYLLHIQIYSWIEYIVKERAGLSLPDSIYYPSIYAIVVFLSGVLYVIGSRIQLGRKLLD